MRFETTLGQTTMHRHLTAFKTDFVVAASTLLLAFVTATGGLTKARADTTTDATFGVLCARCRLDAIEFHHRPLTAL
jgi:hypothetical protein